MRFKKKYASELVDKILAKMEKDERNWPDTIESALVDYFKLKQPTKK